jgi:hypothetical protein
MNTTDPATPAPLCGQSTPNADSLRTQPDYGEPWVYSDLWEIIDRNGNEIQHGLHDEHYERIVACVNACAGIPDPAAHLAAMREAIREAYYSIKNASTVLGTTPRQDIALTKLQPYLDQ